MVLIVEEISKEDFQFLSDLNTTYFQNGVIFDDKSDNVIAFEKIDNEHQYSLSYWKVIEKGVKNV